METQITKQTATIFIPRNRFTFSFDQKEKPTVEDFEKICSQNSDLRFEMNKEGEISAMPPVYSNTSEKNADIVYQLKHWAKKDKSGKVYESSAGFVLPNGAIRSPDASWVSTKRLEKLSDEEMHGFMNICPDFVIKLRSTSDSLAKTKAKMSEYIENGAKLGWLIDPTKKKVHIYRQDKTIEILENPATLKDFNLLKNFELDLSEIL